MLENNSYAKVLLLLSTMLGISMVIGDGSNSISVLSAVGGMRYIHGLSTIPEGAIVGISIIILIVLFSCQRFGTDKVGQYFAPVMLLWFVLLGCIGFYNLVQFDHSITRAVNPKYIIECFWRHSKQAWISLGGIVLTITGTEALFADVGHFSVLLIQLCMCIVTYPSLILAYAGQASFLRMNNQASADAFFISVPHGLDSIMPWLAIMASVIASQAMITGNFSIIKQCISVGCFPRVSIIHTSTMHEDQIYIPCVNYFLMLSSILVSLIFRTPAHIGVAILVMVLTSALMVLIMLLIWQSHILLILSFVIVIGSVELLYLSAVLCKFVEGGT